MPGGSVPQPHSTLANPTYARTLRRLSAAATGETRTARIHSARDTWRTGFVATEVAEFAKVPHRHSSGGDHAGVITPADNADFTPSLEPAVTAEFRGTTVAKPGLWFLGFVLLLVFFVLVLFVVV